MTIPNIIHFIFGLKKQTEEFLFCYYLSIYSAWVINKPSKIFFYYHHKPYGYWWDKLNRIITVLNLIQVEIPTHIGKHKIVKIPHMADKLRMDILYEQGGIYMDIDTISVRPYSHLLNNDVVLGKEKPSGICNAVMLTKPKSEFFKKWIDLYPKHFKSYGWREASIVLPDKIAKSEPSLLNLQKESVFFLPNWNETDKIFVKPVDIPSELITLHLWESKSIKYIKLIDSWNWGFNNKQTLYGKLIIDLISNMVLDKDEYYANKGFFKIINNQVICVKDSKLKKSKKHSSELTKHEVMSSLKGEKYNFVLDCQDNYYICSLISEKQPPKPVPLPLSKPIQKSKPKQIVQIKNSGILHFIYRRDLKNTGDMISSCHNYFKFEDFLTRECDINNIDINSIGINDVVIFSGGGLLDCSDKWNKSINDILDKVKCVIGWGIGFNTHYGKNITIKVNIEKFKLLGIRDYKLYHKYNTYYTPCSSCMLNSLDITYNIIRNIGVIHHKNFPIKLDIEYDTISNSVNIKDFIKFIGESKIILTNSYHAVYLSGIMGKRVIVYKPFSTKFEYIGLNPVIYSGNLRKDITQTEMNFKFKEESIEANVLFYEKVLKLI